MMAWGQGRKLDKISIELDQITINTHRLFLPVGQPASRVDLGKHLRAAWVLKAANGDVLCCFHVNTRFLLHLGTHHGGPPRGAGCLAGRRDHAAREAGRGLCLHLHLGLHFLERLDSEMELEDTMRYVCEVWRMCPIIFFLSIAIET